MNKSTSWVLPLVAGMMAASCGHTAPYQASGPALSKDGVKIALTGERCYVLPNTEQFPIARNDIDDVLHLGLDLEVTNASNHVAVLSLDRFQLAGDTQAEHLVMHPRESGSLSLAPGENKRVALDFEEQTDLDCRHDLALATEGAVAIEGRPVYLASIHFQPSR